MSSSSLEWNGDKVLAQLNKAMKEAVDKSTVMLMDETRELSRIDTGMTRTSYGTLKSYEVNNMVVEGKVGSPMMNSIWEEFGTGEFAENNDGRKGGWVYPKDGKFYFTYGKMPNKPMRRAFTNEITNIENQIKTTIQRGMSG